MAFVAGPALAADEKEEPTWSVGVAGYMQQWVGVSDFDTVYDKDGKNPKEGVSDVQSDSEFYINAKIEADNGLTFKGHIQVEGNGPGNIDESYVSVSGGFGDLRLGAEDDVHSSMHFGEQDVGVTIAAGDVNKWIPVGSSFNTAGWKADRKGISFYSPRMEGVQVGAAWAGGTGNEATGGLSHNDENSWSVGLNYQGEMAAGMTLGLSLGHWNAGTTGEQMVDEDGRTALCGLTMTGEDGGNQKYRALANTSCDKAGTEKGTNYVGYASDDAEHFIPAKSTMKKADDATFSNFGLRVGVGSFGFNFAWATSDTGAYKVQKTPIMYAVVTSTDDLSTASTTLADVNSRLNATSSSTVRGTAQHAIKKGTTGLPATAYYVTGEYFNRGTDKKFGTTTTGGTASGFDAAAAQLVPENTESVVKDMAGESTLMSAGVVFSEGPLGASLHWSQEAREDDTTAETVMLSASYMLAPGVAWKSSVFQAEDDGAKTFNKDKTAAEVEGTGFVTGIAISF